MVVAGLNIAAMRSSRGISQDDLAKRLGCSVSEVEQWEGGVYPSLSVQSELRQALGCTWKDLLFSSSSESCRFTDLYLKLTKAEDLRCIYACAFEYLKVGLATEIGVRAGADYMELQRAYWRLLFVKDVPRFSVRDLQRILHVAVSVHLGLSSLESKGMVVCSLFRDGIEIRPISFSDTELYSHVGASAFLTWFRRTFA